MAISLNIPVTSIVATISAGYTHIRVYRSAEQFLGYTALTSSTSDLLLSLSESVYTFVDGGGSTEHWYTVTFVDVNGVVPPSEASPAFRGSFFDTNFSPITYPEEAVFTSNDRYIIDRMRSVVGDPKQLTRDFVSPDTGYSNMSIDQATLTFSNTRGWPLRVVLDGVDYTDITEPRVNDYQFLTFSGTQVSTISGTLDVWYYHFRNSDVELLRTFNNLTPPPELLPAEVPFELALLCASIEILEAEVRLFGVTSGSEIEIFQEIRINPKGGLTGRLADLAALRSRKEALLARVVKKLGSAGDILLTDIDGTLID